MKIWLLVLFVATAAHVHVVAASEITVVSFGRAEQAALTKAYYRPFGEATGIGVKSFSYDGQTTQLEEMTRTGPTLWDAIQVESRTLELGCRNGLFEKLDYGRIVDKRDLIPGAISECGVGIFAWSMALAYDASKLGTDPRSWADFWDIKKYPGKRGLRRSAKYTLEIALLADGVARGNVYQVLATKEGVDRAFRKLDQIKRDIVWWEAAPQPAEFLRIGNLVMTAAYTLWIDREQQQQKPFKIAWEGSLYDVDSWAIPKGSPKVADAYRFIAFASKPENQKALSKELPYGPTNKKTWPLLDASLADRLPSAEANLSHALKIDTAFWIRHGEALERRFDQWAPPICRQQTDEDEEYDEQPSCQDIHGVLRTLGHGQQHVHADGAQPRD